MVNLTTPTLDIFASIFNDTLPEHIALLKLAAYLLPLWEAVATSTQMSNDLLWDHQKRVRLTKGATGEAT